MCGTFHFLPEFAHSSAPEVTLAVMAQRTSRMRLGFGVLLAPVHHPLHVAARAATLDIFSNGRVDVGVGRTKGPYQITPFGADVSQTQSMMIETLEWAGVDPDAVPPEYQFYVRGGAVRGGGPSWDPQQQKPPTPEELLAGGGYCVGNPDDCIRVIEEFEAMGVDEVMPIFQAGYATPEEVMNSIRLFGKYAIPNFQEKAKKGPN